MPFSGQPDLQLLVYRDPAAAHAELVRLFAAAGGDMVALARQLGVAKTTLWRWVGKLVEAGYADPREGKRGRVGRPPSPRSMESRDSMEPPPSRRGAARKKHTPRKKRVAR